MCLYLDVKSVFSLRQTNARAQQVVNSLHEYHTVANHTLDALRALLQTNSASRITLPDFYRLLQTETCSFCTERYGSLVYLLTWQRCCTECVHGGSEPLLDTCTLVSVKEWFQLSKKALAKLPTLKTLPGTYDTYGHRLSRRIFVVSKQLALAAYKEDNGGEEASLWRQSELHQYRHFTSMACCALPSYDLQIGTLQTGLSCAGCQLLLDILDDQEADIHVQSKAWKAQNRLYSRDEFLEHFQWCEHAQLLWKEFQDEIVEPRSMPAS